MNTVQVYVIKDWNKIYENNRSRELKNSSWVPIPNKLDGDGYTLIMTQKNGAAIYGAWIALILLASKCDVRGTLLRGNGEPHNIDSISRITRLNVDLVEEMIDFSISKTKWLIAQKIPNIA